MSASNFQAIVKIVPSDMLPAIGSPLTDWQFTQSGLTANKFIVTANTDFSIQDFGNGQKCIQSPGTAGRYFRIDCTDVAPVGQPAFLAAVVKDWTANAFTGMGLRFWESPAPPQFSLYVDGPPSPIVLASTSGQGPRDGAAQLIVAIANYPTSVLSWGEASVSGAGVSGNTTDGIGSLNYLFAGKGAGSPCSCKLGGFIHGAFDVEGGETADELLASVKEYLQDHFAMFNGYAAGLALPEVAADQVSASLEMNRAVVATLER